MRCNHCSKDINGLAVYIHTLTEEAWYCLECFIHRHDATTKKAAA